PEPTLQPLVGQTIAEYRVLERLGAGGMGTVYKAFDTKLSRTVALKFLIGEASSSEEARNRLIAEARAASALDHPNIGTIYGIEEAPDSSLFIVMAFYEGATLYTRICRGSMSPAESVSIAAQIASGLAEAHAHHVVHRDIKPANVVLTHQGLAKIVDFGLARVVSSASSTQTAAVTGTVCYMSPEQAQAKFTDHRTDIWALGVILHEMVTGRRAFEGDSVPSTLYAVVHSPPVEMDASVPLDIQRIVLRCLAKSPADRYQTASELLADLQACGAETMPSGTRSLTARDLSRYRELADRSIPPTQSRPARGYPKPLAA